MARGSYYLRLKTLAIGLVIAIYSASFSYAQTPDLPSSAEPGRLQERFSPPDLQQKPIIQRQGSIDLSEIPTASAEAFDLYAVIITGNTAFSEDDFAPIISEYIGKKVDLNILQHLAARITQKYRDSGFFLSRAIIPEQEVNNGTVKILVIEGRAGNIIIDDPLNLLSNDYLNIIARIKLSILSMIPLHGPTLERNVLLLNDAKKFRIEAIIKPSESEQEIGLVDIVLRIIQNDNFGLIDYNNHGSRYIGPHQFSANYILGGLINSFDQTTVQFSTTAETKEVQFLALDYKTPLNDDGLRLSLSTNYARSQPGLNLRSLDVKGQSYSFETALSYPVIRSRKDNLYVGTSLRILNSSTEFLDEELIDDKIRYISLFANYSTFDSLGALIQTDMTVSQGLNLLDATKSGSPKHSRQDAKSEFFSTKFYAKREHTITSFLTIKNEIKAQYSPHALLSSLEFGYGGSSLGRAYDPSEITGDKGISTSIELVFNDMHAAENKSFRINPFVFYDIGKVWNNDTGGLTQSGASAGVGFYYTLNKSLFGSVQAAFPLTKDVETPVMGGKDGPRILFNMSSLF